MSTTDWSIVAAGWAEKRDTVEQLKTEVTRPMLDWLALQPGEVVLELGAGTGDLARELCDAVGPTGSVIATDVAAGMVDVMKATLEGCENADVRQLDAAAIDLADASVDAVVCRMGLMFTTDPASVLAGIRRVLRPGGRVALATWGEPQHNLWASTVGMSVMSLGLISGGPPTGPGGIFSIGTAGQLAGLLEGAGFEASCSEVPVTFTFPDSDSHLDQVLTLAAPLAAAVQNATPEQRVQLRETVKAMTAGYVTDDGLSLPGLAVLGLGRVPG